MDPPPFEIHIELEGWTLFWSELELRPGAGPEQLAALRAQVASQAREQHELKSLSSHPTAAALRKLYRAAGTDPTRYRPASEALMRRILKGADLPVIHPLVDLNNCLSLRLLTPCCVIAGGSVTPPMVWRVGRAGESYESLRGPFDLAGKPLLCDAQGPFDAPITGSRRVMITPQTRRALLVSYLPGGTVDPAAAERELAELLRAAPVAEHLWSAAC